jgi:hypothetical protein
VQVNLIGGRKENTCTESKPILSSESKPNPSKERK